MKPLSLLSLAAALALALPASAQNAGQIAAARKGANCPSCNLFQADFSGVEINGRNYAGARLRQADLSVSVMNRANFRGADLRDVNAYGAVFGGANFAGAQLVGTNFSGAEMGRARGLSQAQLNRACGDGATRLPPGLRTPRC